MPWTDLEHTKCVKLVERVIAQARGTHRDEKAVATTVQEQMDLDRLCQSELNELALLTEAVNGRDPIGVVAVATAFWQNKLVVSRKLALLERKLPNATSCAGLVKQLLAPSLNPATKQALEDDVSVARSKASSRHHSHGAPPDVFLPPQSTTLEHHAALLSEGKFQEVCQLSIQLQQRIAELEHLDDKRKEHARALLIECGDEQNDDDRFSGLIDYANQSHQFMADAIVAVQDLQLLADGAGAGAGGIGEMLSTLGTILPDHINWAILRRGVVPLPDDIEVRPVTASQLVEAHGLQHVTHIAAHSDIYAKEMLVKAQRELRVSRRGVAADLSTSTTGALLHLSRQSRSEVPLDEAMPADTKVVVTQVIPAEGIDECLATLKQRILHVENVELPKFDARVIESRDRIWEAEVEFMTKKTIDPVAAAIHHDGVTAEYRSHLQQVEAERQRLTAALQQCKTHYQALLEGDVRKLSFLLEAHAAEAVASLAATDRICYSARPLELNETAEQFIQRLGIPEKDAYFFTVASETGVPVRMAYIPTTLPRTSLTKLDMQLQAELAAWKLEHPDDAPPLGLIEQLAALRKSDAATLSELLSAHRATFGNLAVEKLVDRNAALERAHEEHEAQILHERRATENMRSQLEGLRSIMESKDRAFHELEGEAARVKEQLQVFLASPQRRAPSSPRSPDIIPTPPGLLYRPIYLPDRNSDIAASFIPSALRGSPQGETFEFDFGGQRVVYVPQHGPRATVSETAEARLRELLKGIGHGSDGNSSPELQQAQAEEVLVLMASLKCGDMTRAIDIAIAKAEQEKKILEATAASQGRADQLSSSLEALTREVEPQRRHLIELRAELESVLRQLADTQRALNEASSDLAASKGELARARADGTEATVVKSEAASVRRELEDARRSAASLQKDLIETKKEAETAKREAASATRQLELTTASSDAKLQSNAMEVQMLRERASAADAKLQQTLSELAAVTGKAASLEAKLVVSNADVARLTDALASSESRNDARNAELLTALDSGRTVEQQLQACKLELAIAQGKVSSTESRLQHTATELTAARTRAASLDDELTQVSADFTIASGKVAVLEQRLQTSNADLTEARAQCIDIQTQLNELKAAAAREAAQAEAERVAAARAAESDRAAADAMTIEDALDASMEGGSSSGGSSKGRLSYVVMQKMLELLRGALIKGRDREKEWKALLSEYEIRAKSEDHAALTDAASAIEKRLEAKSKLLEAQAVEIDNLRAELAAAEKRREAEVQCLAEARQRVLDDRDGVVRSVKQQLEAEKEAHRRTRALLAED